ncbi:acyltransferase [Pandoraea sputorum]|uniref:acyltransferase n=1 Tax=Pandoraea sputorum TaxID=93222 RepID=UPI002B303204|nr:hypothetical protein THI4931_33250 [Pandoraea sputorum]
MSHTLLRVVNNLRRPLPDLCSYLMAKVTSALWKRSIRQVGRGFHICSGALIEGGDGIRIGDGFYAGQQLWIAAVQRYGEQTFTPVIEIGNYVTCSQSVHIAATVRVTIEDGVMFGSRIHVTDHAHGRYQGDVQDSPEVRPTLRPLAPGRPVKIERNVWLGDGVVVLPGVTIGEGCVIGANSVVSRSLPAYVIAVGAPAVPIKRFDRQANQWLPCSTDE